MKKKNNNLPFRKIREINDPDVTKFIKNIFKKDKGLYKSLNDENKHFKFLKKYKRWITSSKLNKQKHIKK